MIRSPLRVAMDRAVARLVTGLPALGRLWARWSAVATRAGAPWTPFTRPLADSRLTLITTGGVHLANDSPFDMTSPDGDPSFRVIPGGTRLADLRTTHDYYDHRDADRDINIVFPLAMLPTPALLENTRELGYSRHRMASLHPAVQQRAPGGHDEGNEIGQGNLPDERGLPIAGQNGVSLVDRGQQRSDEDSNTERPAK